MYDVFQDFGLNVGIVIDFLVVVLERKGGLYLGVDAGVGFSPALACFCLVSWLFICTYLVYCDSFAF